jgi:hypothetical protein
MLTALILFILALLIVPRIIAGLIYLTPVVLVVWLGYELITSITATISFPS